MIHLGPHITAAIHDNNNPDMFRRSVGQLLAGVITNTLSHPFDVITRQMQRQFKDNPQCKPSMFKTAAILMRNPASLWKGLPPRLVLATYGQLLAKETYEQCKAVLSFK